jgi:hypothetical protein
VPRYIARCYIKTLLGAPFLPAYCHGHKATPETPEKGVISVSYANADERGRLIAGIRALAAFLQDHPDVPAPRWADVYVFPPRGTDEQMHAEIDQIAARIGTVVTDDADHGHYAASRHFGPVQYRAVAISGHPDNSGHEGA